MYFFKSLNVLLNTSLIEQLLTFCLSGLQNTALQLEERFETK